MFRVNKDFSNTDKDFLDMIDDTYFELSISSSVTLLYGKVKHLIYHERIYDLDDGIWRDHDGYIILSDILANNIVEYDGVIIDWICIDNVLVDIDYLKTYIGFGRIESVSITDIHNNIIIIHNDLYYTHYTAKIFAKKVSAIVRLIDN